MEPPSSPVSSNVRIAWLEVSAPNPYRGDIASDDDPRPPVVKLYQEFFTAARLAHFNRPFDSSQPASPKTAVHTLSPDQNQEMKVMPLACELKLYNRLGTLVANQQTGGTMAPTPDWTAHTNGSLGWSISGTLGNRPQANDSPQNTDVLWDEFNVPIRLDVVEGAENIILAARSDSGRGLDTFSPVTLPIADLREYPNGFVLQSTGPGRVVIRASLVTKHGLRIVSTTESLMGLLDLDVDSDNSGEIDGSLAEDEMEADPAQTGKLFVYTPSSGDAPGSPESWFEMSLKTSSLRASDKVQFNYDDDQMTIWNSRPDQNPPADQRVVGRGVYTLAELGIVPGTPKSFYVRPGQECGGRQLISVHIIAANANNGTSSDEVAVNLLPVEEAPEVLEVNSDFDEGRIDQATGYAIPDCDDLPGVDLKTGAGNTKLELGAERNHLDGKFTQGQQIVDDLHKGWFGVNPNQLADDFWVGANVTIRKIDKIDDDTGYKESGQVRFYAKWDGGHYGIAPYDFQTLQPVNLVAGGVNLRTNEGVYGASSTIPDGAEFYMEGVRPGKITLEWRLQKGTIDVKHEQSFKVVTQKALDAWRDELRYQIRLQSSVAGEEVDLNNFDPMDEFTSNTKFLKATYGWYQQNFVQSEDKLIWAGMAKMAGAPVYAALSDAQVARAVGPGIGVELIARQLQRALMKGNKDIFLDLAWQHRAYAASGISALKFVDDNDASLGLRSVQMTDWVTIDKGVWLDSLFKSSFGARELLRREQRFIIEAVYLEITSLGLDDIISNLAKNPIPNLPPLGKSFAEVVQGGNLAFFDDRWQWIKSDMYPGWTGITEFSLDLGVELGSGSGGYSKANRLTYSKIDLSTRARNYATFPSSVP
ncbi:MAG: hypothetical protein ORN51_06900 [Akkermansiaceae bacterium]|nr:hypothetical protein [Akkermansiaceae bacterium]